MSHWTGRMIFWLSLSLSLSLSIYLSVCRSVCLSVSPSLSLCGIALSAATLCSLIMVDSGQGFSPTPCSLQTSHINFALLANIYSQVLLQPRACNVKQVTVHPWFYQELFFNSAQRPWPFSYFRSISKTSSVRVDVSVSCFFYENIRAMNGCKSMLAAKLVNDQCRSQTRAFVQLYPKGPWPLLMLPLNE